MKAKHQRLILVGAALVAMIGAVLLAMSAIKDRASYFYTPAEALADKVTPGTAIRLGGMVVPGSFKRGTDGVTVSFAVSDTKASVPATFTGILPDLFKEGSGVVAEGAFTGQGTFVASNVLAKHDERYMPREMSGMKYDEKTHKVTETK